MSGYFNIAVLPSFLWENHLNISIFKFVFVSPLRGYRKITRARNGFNMRDGSYVLCPFLVEADPFI